MSASVFIVDADLLDGRSAGDVVLLDGDEGHHAVAVVRVRIGEEIHLVDGRGTRARGVVRELPGGDVAGVEILQIRDEPVPVRAVTVVQALPKGEHGELAVDLLTQAGVDRIVPWAAEHSISVWRGEKATRGVAKWQSAAVRVAKQCRRSRIPHIDALASTGDVIDRIRAAAGALVLHEESSVPLAHAMLPEAGEIIVIVGPEGGISRRERDAFTEAGAIEVGLGPQVLRSSFAGAAALITMSAMNPATSWKDA